MTNNTRIALLIVACLLILSGLVGGILSLVLENSKAPAPEGTPSQTTAQVTATDDGTFDTNAKDITVEYTYNDDGTLKSEKFYKNGAYYGIRDYYYADGADHTILFNAAGERIGETMTTYNATNGISEIIEYSYGKLVKSIEYSYYNTGEPLKKLTKSFKEGESFAEKVYYSLEGKKTELIQYKNDVEVAHYYFDENGNVTKDSGDTK